jgi:hypothetical protein
MAARKPPPPGNKQDPDALPIKEQIFVSAYLAHGNATQAAKDAGYSPKTAYSRGHALRKRPRVAKALEAAKTRIIQTYQASAERTIEEMALIGYSDLRHYRIGADGHVTLAPGAPDSAMRAIRRVKRRAHIEMVGTGKKKKAVLVYDTEIELWSKDQQLRNVGEHLKMFKENRGGDHPLDPDDELTPEQRTDRIVALMQVALKRKKQAAAGKKKAG